MDESSKLLLTVAVPTITVLVGILVNHRQLRQHVDTQIISLRNELTASIQRVEGVLAARLKLVEEILKIR